MDIGIVGTGNLAGTLGRAWAGAGHTVVVTGRNHRRAVEVATQIDQTAVEPADFAARVEPLFEPAPTGPDLRVLAVLQRDGRLVDFLQEDIDGYSDAQIGAAVRDIHRGCRKSLRDYLTIEPIIAAAEE